jgi:hypothetical protein
MFYVYQLRDSRKDLPFYIGKGKGLRAWDHLREAKGKDITHKLNTIRKIQGDGFEVIIEFLKVDLDEDSAFMWEWFYIAEFGRADEGLGCLTNATDGQDGLAGLPRSEASKIKQSQSVMGSNNHFYGKTHSEEMKSRMSELKTGSWSGANNPNSGGITNQVQLKRMSDATKNAVKTPCPHCNVPVDPRNMSRWHGDKCKQRRVP